MPAPISQDETARTGAIMVRKQIRARLWDVYVTWCKNRKPSVGTVAKDYFNKQGWGPRGRDAKDRSVMECTCGKCFYLGKQGFDLLVELLNRAKLVHGDMPLLLNIRVPAAEAVATPPATVGAYIDRLLVRVNMQFEMMTTAFPQHCAFSS